jgi:Immunity protein Imm1
MARWYLAIELLTVCEWNGQQMNRTEFPRPTWEQVEDAIRDLDERAHNDLYLHPDASNLETYLAVGGGSGRYLVTGSVNNLRFPTAVKHAESNAAREPLVVGGQTGDYPRHWILDLDSALRAARSFFEAAEFAGGGVIWLDA